MSWSDDRQVDVEVDMSSALRAAVAAAGPGWAAQPSRLRLGLTEVLGTEAPGRRTQIHHLVVAAEERVPSHLADAPIGGAPLQELASDLAAARGWTPAAAEWAVTTWARAMGVTGAPADATPEGFDRPSSQPAVGPTVLPVAVAASEPDIHPTVLPTDAVASDTSTAPVPLSDLPRSGTGAHTRSAAALLGHEIDIAFSVRKGPGLGVLLPLAFVGLVGVALGGPVGTLAWLTCSIALFASVLSSRYRVLAFAGDQAWLLSTRGPWSTAPSAVLHHGWRNELRSAGGWLLPAVSFGGQRLRFYFPTTRAGRMLSRGAPR